MKDKIIDDCDTNVGQERIAVITFEDITPKRTPIIPPVILIAIASIKN